VKRRRFVVGLLAVCVVPFARRGAQGIPLEGWHPEQVRKVKEMIGEGQSVEMLTLREPGNTVEVKVEAMNADAFKVWLQTGPGRAAVKKLQEGAL